MAAQALSVQVKVSIALQELGFAPEKEEPDGSLLQHKVTQKAIDRLQVLLRDGQSIYVSSSGDLTVIK